MIVIKHVPFFTVCATEITSSNGIHTYLSGCNCGFGFEEKHWRIDEFGEKKGGFVYPYSPPSLRLNKNLTSQVRATDVITYRLENGKLLHLLHGPSCFRTHALK